MAASRSEHSPRNVTSVWNQTGVPHKELELPLYPSSVSQLLDSFEEQTAQPDSASAVRSEDSCVHRVVTSSWFEAVSLIIICLNVAFSVFRVDWEARNVDEEIGTW